MSFPEAKFDHVPAIVGHWRFDRRDHPRCGGRYEALVPDSIELHVFGQACRVVTLSRLIALGRAAGRPKDREAIAELEALDEERR